MIRTENVAVTFNKGSALENRALREITLTIPTGQFVTVIGSNGAGKSTLLNILAGELTPDRGRVFVDDQDVTLWPVHRRARMIARLFQDPRAGICENMSIIENIAVAAARTSPRGFRFAISRALRHLATERLASLRLGLEMRLDDRVSLLSGGQRQALALVMGTMGPTRVLLLDEHTAALDPAAGELVMKLTDQVVRESAITSVMERTACDWRSNSATEPSCFIRGTSCSTSADRTGLRCASTISCSYSGANRVLRLSMTSCC